MAITYRKGEPDDIPEIVELLEAEGLTWPGAASTPYVAVGESGAIELVYFKSICWHAEPLVGKRDSAASVTELAKVMYRDFQDLADEAGESITVYASVQKTPQALAAARKNGMVPVAGDHVLHQITIPPRRRAGNG